MINSSLAQRLPPFLRGHLLCFENPLRATYAAAAGTRLLLIFLLVEIAVGPRMANLGAADTSPWFRVVILFSCVLLAVRVLAKVRFADIGLRPWSQWGPTERSFAPQVIVLAIAVFGYVFGKRLDTVFGDAELRTAALLAIPLQLAWGFYQELIYRGILQTELTRRIGTRRGILLSNLLFTFGPLHFYHFATSSSPVGMFAAIFGIGLFFALLCQRSGNLWIVGILHGIGDWYIDGLGKIVG